MSIGTISKLKNLFKGALSISAVAGAVPVGGTGATAGAFDTAANRDALLATVTEIKTQLNLVIAELKK